MKSALSQSFGYEKCTPVQSAIFSKLPIENDLLVQAKTGTGKTLGFLIPSLEIIKNKTHPFGKEAKVLILSPTRELALQIHAEAKRICKPFRFGAQYLVGGESKLFQELVQSTLKPGYELINTISPEDVNTVQSIKQSYHVTTMSEQFIQLHSLLNRGMNSGQPFKCIVFWNTSKMTAAMANLFRE
ncbi:hypothetical protein HMI55_005156, partial [Coelomomyces lativittatus]